MNPNDLTQLENIRRVVDEVASQLRQNQPVYVPTNIYMEVYNFSFQASNQIIIRNFYVSWIQKYLSTFVIDALTQVESTEFMDTFLDEFGHFKSLTMWLTKLFTNYELKQGRRELFIVELGLLEFEKVVMSGIQAKYMAAYNNALNQIRMGVGEKEKLKAFQNILITFQNAQTNRLIIEFDTNTKQSDILIREKVSRQRDTPAPINNYGTYVVGMLIDNTKQFYGELTTNWLQTGSATEFIKRGINQMNLERELLDTLYYSNKPQILQCLQEAILTDKAQLIINNPQSGLKQLIDQHQTAQEFGQITNMYEFYKETLQNLEIMVRVFNEYIKLQVEMIFIDAPVQNILQLHIQQMEKLYIFFNYCTRLMNDCFSINHRFRNFMELGFKEKLNSNDKFISKFAFFINVNLKDKLKETNNDSDVALFKQFQTTTMKLLEFINNKQSLFIIYRNNLKDRIFKGEIKNHGYEEEFLKELKKRHPEHLPTDVQTTWSDYKASRDLDMAFNNILQQKDNLRTGKAQMTVFTRTNTLFEFNKVERIELPAMLMEVLSDYEQFYKSRLRTQKVLQWNMKIGQGIVSYTTSQATFKLLVSNVQIIILLYLKQGVMSVNQLANISKMKETDIQHHIAPIVQVGLIDVTQDNFQLNADIKTLKVPIRGGIVPLIPKKSADQIDEQNRHKQEMDFMIKDRDLRIQSVIVRLMKSKKSMFYQELIDGTAASLNGYYQYSNKDVLRQIDELITGDYIKRDDKVNNKFNYTPAQ